MGNQCASVLSGQRLNGRGCSCRLSHWRQHCHSPSRYGSPDSIYIDELVWEALVSRCFHHHHPPTSLHLHHLPPTPTLGQRVTSRTGGRGATGQISRTGGTRHTGQRCKHKSVSKGWAPIFGARLPPALHNGVAEGGAPRLQVDQARNQSKGGSAEEPRSRPRSSEEGPRRGWKGYRRLDLPLESTRCWGVCVGIRLIGDFSEHGQNATSVASEHVQESTQS